jgi:hypothetical protein
VSEQFDLFAPRRRNIMRHYKDTSRQAHRTRSEQSAILDNLILDEISKAMPDGITCQQIELNLNRRHESVSGNLSHLVNDEVPPRVKDSGRKGKVMSGRAAILWVLA